MWRTQPRYACPVPPEQRASRRFRARREAFPGEHARFHVKGRLWPRGGASLRFRARLDTEHYPVQGDHQPDAHVEPVVRYEGTELGRYKLAGDKGMKDYIGAREYAIDGTGSSLPLCPYKKKNI